MEYKVGEYYLDPEDNMVIKILNIMELPDETNDYKYKLEVYYTIKLDNKQEVTTHYNDVCNYSIRVKVLNSPLYKVINNE